MRDAAARAAGARRCKLQSHGRARKHDAALPRVALLISTAPHAPALATQEKKDRKASAKDAAPGAAGDVEGASIEELNQKVVTLEREKNKEEEYRNYMQLERVRRPARPLPGEREGAGRCWWEGARRMPC